MTDLPAPPAFVIPDALAASGFSIRPETDADLPFLQALYASTRADELAQVTGWSAEQKAAFLGQQFAAQRAHYRGHFPASAFDVIERHGVPVGRLYLEQRGETLHIIDIALLPDQRSQGNGTALLRAIIATADARSLGVGIFVEHNNPALRLYRRLGFVEIGDTGVYLEMQRAPDGADAVTTPS